MGGKVKQLAPFHFCPLPAPQPLCSMLAGSIFILAWGTKHDPCPAQPITAVPFMCHCYGARLGLDSVPQVGVCTVCWHGAKIRGEGERGRPGRRGYVMGRDEKRLQREK